MAVTSTQSCEPKTHLREGAIYSDSSNNIIRLLSIRGDYCVYVYVALAGCGKTRFEADAVPQNSLVSTAQPDKKKVCVDKTSSRWMCSAT